MYSTAFIAVFDPDAAEQPVYRLQSFDAGVNMVAHDVETLRQILTEVVIPSGLNGHFSCPYCNLGNLTEYDMWLHCPAYHINFPNEYPMSNVCPICQKQVNRPLQEFANQGFWCPGGAVDPGERLGPAALRETKEEAGIDIELKGILAIEYNPCGLDRRQSSYFVRMRIIFYAEPTAEGLQQLPKSRPDFESAGACWCSYEEIQGGHVKLRGNEPQKWSK
eukprot:gene130-81_t